VRNILVIKLRYVGDVLLATPVIKALRQRWPAASITVAVNRGTEAILKYNDDVNDVIIVERESWTGQVETFRAVRNRRFDCVIDLTDSDRSALLSAWTGAPERIGFNWEHRWRGLLYTTVVQAAYGRMHMVEYDLQALTPLGIRSEEALPILCTGPEEERAADRLVHEGGMAGVPWVMIHPGARYWFKAWPPERFAALIDRLGQEQIAVGLVGDGRDHEVAEHIRGLAKHRPVSFVGRTSLLELAALMKRCALFIGNDAGPMHMAAAVWTPVIGLFGPSDPAVWGPRAPQVEVIYKGMDCHACFHATCIRGEESCMKLISVDEVFEAARRFLPIKQEPVSTVL
jgi:predicted lipopolysaccharide heptosyltransferase III